MASSPIWLTEQDCAALMSLRDAIDVLERALRLEAAGAAHNVAKAIGRWGDAAAMHCLGAMMPDAGVVGWKTWAITPRGGGVTYELFDANMGGLKAVMQAITLGQLRTAAMTGLGTRWLAAPDADTLAIVGTGRQALAQVAAVALVRPIRTVFVYGRSAERREAFATLLRGAFPFEVVAAGSLEDAVGRSAITTLVTRATEPFLDAAMLPPGAHLNAVGAILPTHAEFHDAVFDRASLIAVDSVADTRRNSREFKARFGEGDWPEVHSLSAVIAGDVARPDRTDLTLFKAMGMGISDLSVAAEIYTRAVAGGVGAPLSATPPAPLRWT